MNYFLCLAVCLMCVSPGFAQPSAPSVLGEWEGESKCTVPDSPCHDEHVIYQITHSKTEEDAYSIAADKVVHGKRQFMGTLSCRHDSSRAILTCTGNTQKHDEWIFHIEGNNLKGTLTIDPNKLLYRRVSLKRKS